MAIITAFLWAHALFALAAAPSHARRSTLDLSGFNHACGVAIDSAGDVYVSSAGENVIKVYDSTLTPLTTIADANEPCGLAVDSKGQVFVSQQATGDVVRFKPNSYPFVGTPTYGSAEPIDSSGEAKGLALDRYGRLYVAEGDHLAVYKSDGSFEGNLLEGEVSEATGVAVYVYPVSINFADRHIYVAEGSGHLAVFGGSENLEAHTFAPPKLQRTIEAVDQDHDPETPAQELGFGPAGAYLAIDPGNANAEGKCVSVAEQACTAGHLLLYDASHEAVDEFDASGEFLDQITNASFADAEPTALAIDRSGGPRDGTIYVTSGSSSGAAALAFAPLVAPGRAGLPEEPPSHVLPHARRVVVDSKGYVYVLSPPRIHIYSPSGEEIAVGSDGKGIEDAQEPENLDVDSEGNVYVVDSNDRPAPNFEVLPDTVTYYSPSAYPPVNGTTYARHAPIVEKGSFEEDPGAEPEEIAVNPANDHLLVVGRTSIIELDSVAEGSDLIRNFAPGLDPSFHANIDVDGKTGNVYLATNPEGITVINGAGTEVLARFKGGGGPTGLGPGQSPRIAVDQSNGHVLAFDNMGGAAQEYDAYGAFVASFQFAPPQEFTTTNGGEGFDIAIDNSSGPTRGRVYVAFDDPKPGTPDLWAFAPLAYGEAPLAKTVMASGLGAGGVTLNGTVNPRGFETTGCRFEYLLDSEYQANVGAEDPPFSGATQVPCSQSAAEIGKGFAPVPVSGTVANLAQPNGRYRFRLVAENKYASEEEAATGAAILFGPPVVSIREPLSILYTEAILRSNVDPTGLDTTYRFQYGKAAGEYDQETPLGEIPGESAPTTATAGLVGLAEGATYHYRIVAVNEDATVLGPDQEFTTLVRPEPQTCENAAYRTGLSANLPDCRAYELVTPAETNGLTPNAGGLLSSPPYFDTWLTPQRGVGAGERFAYFTFGTLPGYDGNGVDDGYRAQRAAGDHPPAGWQSDLFGPTYEQSVPEATLVPPGQTGVSADQLYSFWQIEPSVSLPGTLPTGTYLRTPAGFEAAARGPLGDDLEGVGRYVAAGGAQVIFTSAAHLHESTPPAGTQAVYRRPAGSSAAEVVSLKPTGAPFAAGENASYLGANGDGSAVAFSVAGALYLNRDGKVSQVAPSPSGSQSLSVQGISADGSRVYYRNPETEGLYLCEVTVGSCAGAEATHAPLQIAGETSFAKPSTDGARVVFVSEEALTSSGEENENGEHAEAGVPNLYSWSVGQGPTFVARLVGKGSDLSVQSTPDGNVFVFESKARLTAYDNEGKGEVYRYRSGAAAEELLCVSCDPSNAPPVADAKLKDLRTSSGLLPHIQLTNVTDDGEMVFFQSTDRLLPEDANDVEDVYEWRAKGTSNCIRDDGCLGLISSGQGEADSYLYGMSADGHDVFFRTRDKLVGSDVPGSPSIYDARVGGGIPEPVAPAPCQGDACQGQGAAVPALPSPSTAAPAEGNVRTQPRCGKGKHRVKGRCARVKHHHSSRHKKNHRRRAAHNGEGNR